MYKKILSLLLTLTMLVSVIPVYAEDVDTDITVYLTVSQYGDFVQDKNGNDMVCAEINLSGKSSYTIDDAFSVAHGMYHPDGTDAYASSTSEWGMGVDKLWGDTSYNFGYQVNSGSVSVSGPGHILENGDHIDAAIYKNLYPDTEAYAKFNAIKGNAGIGESIEVTLSYVSAYEGMNMIFSPCSDATITVNGEETELVTDENGTFSISFDNAGIYVISAKKEKILNDNSVPAIAAPVFVLRVADNNEESAEIIHNIAEYYSDSDLLETGSNLPWIIADMAVYEELFPNSENVLTQEQKQEAAESIVDVAMNTTVPGDVAKSIIALRALGYDAEKIYTEEFEWVSLVEKLHDMVENDFDVVTNIYTLPYVIIALSQGEGYSDDGMMERLITAAYDSRDLWHNTEFGTDAMTPMILALGSYGINDEIITAVNDAVDIVKSQQRKDGLIDGYRGYEPASTGLAICALSAMEIDSDMVENCYSSLIDGLLSSVNDERNGFPNSFATEQGFRGLLAWRLLTENSGKSMYDFFDYPMNELNISGIEYCPVIFELKPSKAKITVDDAEQFDDDIYDLAEGEYTYTVSASGYNSEEGTIEISSQDAMEHATKTISVSLSKKPSSGGGGGGISISTPSVMEKPIEETPAEKSDAQKPVLLSDTFGDVSEDDWYYNAVKYVYENNLFSGTDAGFEPDKSMTRAMLVTVLYRFASPTEKPINNSFSDVSDNAWYTEGVCWAAENNIVNGMSDEEFAPDESITREQIAVILYRFAMHCGYDISAEDVSVGSFADFEDISPYATDAMEYVLCNGIINGKADGRIAPKASATRAEVATMLMRFAEGIK